MVYSSKDLPSKEYLDRGILRKAWSRFSDFRQMVQKDAQESLSDSSDRNASRRRGGDSVRSSKG